MDGNLLRKGYEFITLHDPTFKSLSSLRDYVDCFGWHSRLSVVNAEDERR